MSGVGIVPREDNFEREEKLGAADVIIEDVCIVCPAKPTIRERMFLSSCDLVCRPYPYINRLFFYNHNNSTREGFERIVERLKESLSEVLVAYYPLAGRFSSISTATATSVRNGFHEGVDEEREGSCYEEDREGEKGRLMIDCNEEGVEFLEASTQFSFAELLSDGFQYRPFFMQLAPKSWHSRSDYTDKSIFSAQITKFAGGGYAIGISCSHVVADAQSFYDFAKSWAEICRGDEISLLPIHMRSVLKLEKLVELGRVNSHPNGYIHPNMGDNVESKQNHAAKDEKMEKEKVDVETNGDRHPCVENKNMESKQNKGHAIDETDHAKEKQNVEVEANGKSHPYVEDNKQKNSHAKDEPGHAKEQKPRRDLIQKVYTFQKETLQYLKKKASMEGGEAFTTFEALCAHWWKALVRARKYPAEQRVTLLVPINCRNRYWSLPRAYFGNLLDGAAIVGRAMEISEENLGRTARRIHEGVASAGESSFLARIRSIEAMANRVPHFDRNGLFHVVDSPRFPIYETDFGWGPPSAVRAEGFRSGAEVQMLVGHQGNGSIDVFLSLPRDCMQTFEDDHSFLSPC